MDEIPDSPLNWIGNLLRQNLRAVYNGIFLTLCSGGGWSYRTWVEKEAMGRNRNI